MNALISNTTGGYNTASGYEALKSNTTGANNTTLGYRAGDVITTGNIILLSDIRLILVLSTLQTR